MSLRVRALRPFVVTTVVLGGLLVAPVTGSAQGFGVGARVAWVNPDTEVDVDALRYFGGQIRFIGGHFGLEASLDRHSESSEVLNEKYTETPVQVSLLLRGGGKITPFVLGGMGWYRRTVEVLDGPSDLAVTTTEFGWHAGLGLEILPSTHFGIHGDYRYTFLDFGGDDDSGGIIGGLLPGHRGSMWTLGATVYF